MKRPARRTILRVMLLLIAGAALNVAVAWSIARFAGGVPSANDNYRVFGVDVAADYWKRYAPPSWHDAVLIAGNASESWAVGRTEFVVVGIEPIKPSTTKGAVWTLGHYDAGWPMLAMRVRCLMTADAKSRDIRAQWGLSAGASGTPSKPLPLMPLWPGFAVNTLFYAGVLWMLFCSPLALRRMIRRRRGLCAACGYPIGSSDVCTECGAAVMPAKAGIQ